jgi:hypothetical protein
MTNALPTARASGLHGAAPDPWITLNRSSSTYFEERAVQESGATSDVRGFVEFFTVDVFKIFFSLKIAAYD